MHQELILGFRDKEERRTLIIADKFSGVVDLHLIPLSETGCLAQTKT